MSNLNKITITGDLGGGKSVVSRLLCEKTGFHYLSTGQVQRQLAAAMGIDTLAMNRLADVDPTIDEKIDSVFVNLAQDPEGYVVDSRLAWFFLPASLKVYLRVPVEVAVQRILSDPNRSSEQYADAREAAQKILARKASENARFLKKYGANCADMRNFDLVIDTADISPEEVSNQILEALRQRQN